MRTNRTMAERVFAAFLSLILVLGLFPVSVMRTSAEETAPMYGTVDAYTQGLTITGSGTEAVAVSNGEITLDYAAADESIGRLQDGWWVGFKVTAPAGLTEEQLKSAVYGRKPDDMTKSFWDNQNSAQDAQEHFIDLWSYTSEAYLEQNKTSYTWYFCWDGTNVQKVQLKMDPTKITLKGGIEETYRLTFGTVEALTQGTANITGNGTADVTVVQEAAELTYDGGWKVGIKVVAPAGFSTGALFSNVTNGDSDQLFTINKDGEDYIELWLPVSEADLVNKTDLTSVYSFDWNGNHIYEQTVTFRVNTSGNIVLKNALGQQEYPYLYGSVDAADALVTGNGTRNVTVDLNGRKVQWNNGWETSVKVSLNGQEKSIPVSFASVEDNEVDHTEFIDWNDDGLTDQIIQLTGTVKLLKAEQEKPAFANATLGIDTRELYTGASNAVTNADKAQGKISYAIAENKYLTIDGNGKISVNWDNWRELGTILYNGGSVDATVTVTFGETDTHNASSATYTVAINPKEDDSLKFAKNKVTEVYGGQDGIANSYTQVPTTKGKVDTIEYVSSETSVATVDENGKVTFLKAGTVTITANVTYAEQYTPTSCSYTLEIKKGTQKPLTFEKTENVITYNDENGNAYTNVATGGTLNNTISYSIMKGGIIADINGATLSILAAGEVEVMAYMAGDDCYEPVKAYYTLTIKKAEQKIALEASSATVENSQDTHTIAMVTEEGWISSKDYNFQIIEKDPTVTGTTVDATTGVITIDADDFGKLTVKVTRPGDDCFLDWAGQTFELTIEQIKTSAANFKFEGAKHEGAEDSSWYCGPVTITYEDGVPYKVSTATGKTKDWHDSYTIDKDGIHNPVLSLKSTAKKGAVKYGQEVGTVKIDQTAPVSTIIYTETVWGSVFEKLTFGFYDAPTTVKITAEDGKGDVSGVSAIFYKLAGDENFTEVKGNQVVVDIPDQYIGKVEFYAVDKAGNVEGEKISETTIVVDSTKADWTVAYDYAKQDTDLGEAVYTDKNGVQYTRFDTTVTLKVTEKFFDLSLEALKLTENGKAAANAPVIKGDDSRSEWTKGEDGVWTMILDLTTEGDHDLSMEYTNRSGLASDSYSQKVVIDRTVPVCEIVWDAAELIENTTRYNKSAVSATITVTDANFNPDNTVVTDKITLANGSEETKPLTAEWTQKDNEWTAVVTLTEEGIHNLTVDTTDWAGNVMETKTTDEVILDFTAPAIDELVFTGAAVQNTEDGRAYFNQNVTAVVTIIERNFDENKVIFDMSAKDVTGADVTASYTMGEWKHNGDEHTVELLFAADANYTLDVFCIDKANNQSNDVAEKLFTVDHVAPEILSVSYSKPVFQEILEKVTFGYYNAPVTVTVEAKDATAGVKYFDYKGLLHGNVSTVNAACGASAVAPSAVNGDTFTLTFQIPGEALTNKNQFNGYLDITATDKSANTSTVRSEKESMRLIVDNIAPKLTVGYNDPVQVVDKVSYYAEDIVVTITINDANLNARLLKDKQNNFIQIAVTRDGTNYPVTVDWTDTSLDVHVGTFKLTEDGDYVVKVNGADPSGNAVDKEHVSNQLTLDTTLPVVEVTNVVANSANTDAVYTFDVIATDINIDPATFEPVLTGIFLDEEGKFVTKTIDMGDIQVVKKDETYSFTVKNLEEDAIYTLTCTVSDYSRNVCDEMLLEDEKQYNEVQFSINRNGSTYMLDDSTATLVGKYYVQNVTNDVVLVEINPDVLKQHSVTLNGRELTKGDEYGVKEEGGNGSWMKYTYTVNKGLMAEEGEYNLVVSSEDKAGNKAFSDVKGANIGYVVDRTAPVVTITGMQNDGRYQVESQTVTLIPMDPGGALRTLSVYLVDDDGNVLEELVNLSGEELYEALEENEDQITFQIDEGLYQNVQVVCTDMAVDEEGATNAYDETFTNISVSSSAFMIFWANKPLRYGVIFGGLALIALILFILFGKKKKENK